MAQKGTSGSEHRTIAAFVLMVVGIGGNVVSVKYIAREGELDPFWAAASRFLIASAIFAGIARLARAELPRGRALLGAILYGALSIGAFFGFVYWGLQEAPAGMAAVFLATNPLLTFLLAIAHGVERFRWDSMIGAACVVAGTGVVFSGGIGDGIPVLSLLAILAAAACAAEGSIVVKTYPKVHPAMRNAIGMATGTVMLFALMPVFGAAAGLPTTAPTWIAQAYLVTFGSVGVFGLYLFVLGRWTASAVSYEFVAAPLVGIVLAGVLLGETITGMFVAGSALVLVGVYFGAIRPAHARAQPGSQPEEAPALTRAGC